MGLALLNEALVEHCLLIHYWDNRLVEFLITKKWLGSDRHSISSICLLSAGELVDKLHRFSAMGSLEVSNIGKLIKPDIPSLRRHLPLPYPKFKRDVTKIDQIHDRKVSDPYRL